MEETRKYFDYCLHGNVTVEGLIINYTVFMAFGEVTCMIFGGVSPWWYFLWWFAGFWFSFCFYSP